MKSVSRSSSQEEGAWFETGEITVETGPPSLTSCSARCEIFSYSCIDFDIFMLYLSQIVRQTQGVFKILFTPVQGTSAGTNKTSSTLTSQNRSQPKIILLRHGTCLAERESERKDFLENSKILPKVYGLSTLYKHAII